MLIAIDDFEKFVQALNGAAEAKKTREVWYELRLIKATPSGENFFFVAGFLASGCLIVCRILVATSVTDRAFAIAGTNAYAEQLRSVGVDVRRGKIIDSIDDQLPL